MEERSWGVRKRGFKEGMSRGGWIAGHCEGKKSVGVKKTGVKVL